MDQWNQKFLNIDSRPHNLKFRTSCTDTIIPHRGGYSAGHQNRSTNRKSYVNTHSWPVGSSGTVHHVVSIVVYAHKRHDSILLAPLSQPITTQHNPNYNHNISFYTLPILGATHFIHSHSHNLTHSFRCHPFWFSHEI